MEPRKQAILSALDAFVRQRSGMDYRNYGDVKSYRAEQRSITRDLHDYRFLRRSVELRDSITADMILEASRSAFSGRLTIQDRHLSPEDGGEYRPDIDYCTGQYFPTEYRKAACAVLAQTLWYWTREHAMPETERDEQSGQTMVKGVWQTPGDWLRANFRREFGRSIAARWFN